MIENPECTIPPQEVAVLGWEQIQRWFWRLKLGTEYGTKKIVKDFLSKLIQDEKKPYCTVANLKSGLMKCGLELGNPEIGQYGLASVLFPELQKQKAIMYVLNLISIFCLFS